LLISITPWVIFEYNARLTEQISRNFAIALLTLLSFKKPH
jgi:hypothetical protein